MPAPPSGSLRLDNHKPVQGESITFSYETTDKQVNKLNWIGLYRDPGNGPIHEQYVGAR